jgi:hypothetical protein
MSNGRFGWKMFIGIAVFMSVIGVVYWFVSYEPAGTTMLGLSAALAALCGAYLRVQYEGRDRAPAPDDHYLPHASPWPFGVGLGAMLAVNGLIVGLGFAIPGVIVLGISIGGLLSESRRRA